MGDTNGLVVRGLGCQRKDLKLVVVVHHLDLFDERLGDDIVGGVGCEMLFAYSS